MEGRNEKNAMTVLFLGIGVIALAVGLCTDLYSAPLGLLGLVCSWVVALTLRAFYGLGDRDEGFYDRWGYH